MRRTITTHSMRRRKDQSEVGFTARIPANHKAAVDKLLPMSGGKRWLIETALEEFVTLCEAQPKLVSWVNDQVLQMREDGRPQTKIVDFLPRVRTDLYVRFNRLFPEKGATTWFIRAFVENYIHDSEDREPMGNQVREVVRLMLGAETAT